MFSNYNYRWKKLNVFNFDLVNENDSFNQLMF